MSSPLSRGATRGFARAQRHSFATSVLVLVASCTGNQASDDASEARIPSIELRYRERYSNTSIELQGTVLDIERQPVAGAEVSVGDSSVTTDDTGHYVFDALSRRTSLMAVRASGYQPDVIAVWLRLPLSEEVLALDPVLLAPKVEGQARFVFAGDVSLGRGFISPGGENGLTSIPEPSRDVLIPTDDADEASRAVVGRMRPIFDVADYATLNLETVVTDNPATPFPGKAYVFFSLPDSLSALDELGIGFVSLGNNHVYDYLELGLTDTLRNVAARGVGASGAGPTPNLAFEPYRVTVTGVDYSMISASTIQSEDDGAGLVASEDQGGSADAADTARFTETIATEAEAGRAPIVHLHSGVEYTEHPVDATHERMKRAVDSGAAMVIGHHPHVPQGFEWYEGRLIAHSLGNFVFDQERVETMLTQVVRADIDGAGVANVRSIPVFIEDFQPRPIAGAMADTLLRRIGLVSAPYGGVVFPYLHQGWIVQPGEFDVETETLDVPVSIGDTGFAVVDMRLRADSRSSIAGVEVSEPGVSARIGRDILQFGDMEDVDVDDDDIETSRWWYSGVASFPCMHEVHRGAVALCSCRSWDSSDAAVLSFRQRVRVLGDAENEPNKDLTLLAYTQADNAGKVTVSVRYYSSGGDTEFGEESVWEGGSASWDWKPIVEDLHMPADDPQSPTSSTKNARALRILIKHMGPKRGEAWLRVDDVAVVTWEESLSLDGSEQLVVPHSRDFIRFEGEPGEFVARVTLTTLNPSAP